MQETAEVVERLAARVLAEDEDEAAAAAEYEPMPLAIKLAGLQLVGFWVAKTEGAGLKERLYVWQKVVRLGFEVGRALGRVEATRGVDVVAGSVVMAP